MRPRSFVQNRPVLEMEPRKKHRPVRPQIKVEVNERSGMEKVGICAPENIVPLREKTEPAHMNFR